MAGAAPPVATMTDDRYVRSRRSRRSLLLHPGLCFEAHRQPDRTWHVQIAGMATATGARSPIGLVSVFSRWIAIVDLVMLARGLFLTAVAWTGGVG